MTSKKTCIIFNLSLLLAVLANSVWARPVAKDPIIIAYDLQNKTAAFTASQMKSDLTRAGFVISLIDLKNVKAGSATQIVLTMVGSPTAKEFTLPTAAPQAYSLRRKGNNWYVIAADARGMIAGGLDLSDNIAQNGISAVTDVDRKPYLTYRGIKFNIPLDARTPSYTDNGDSGQQNIGDMWDINFWHEFLDEMASKRYNVLSLWSLQPFPSLVKVPEYPNASLNDIKKTTTRLLPTSDGIDMSTPTSLAHLVTLKKMTIDEKIKFWQDVMQYGHDRGIEFYLFTWNLFINGLENSGYGFRDDASDPKIKDYVRKATRTLLQTYPLLGGIGLTVGENLRIPNEDKEKVMYETYGMGINDALAEQPDRKFVLIHRAHQANMDLIKNIFKDLNKNCELRFSYKYSVAQMYSSTAPKYIYDEKFIDKIGDSNYYLTVRDDSWYYLRGGSDPDFARTYIKNMPQGNLQGFYMGPDGYTWGRVYSSRESQQPRPSMMKKRWYSFGMMGKLAYNPDLPNAYFVKELALRFPEVNAQKLYTAWARASQIFPTVTRFHNQRLQNDFEWYPEACTSYYGFQTVEKFITRLPQAGEGLLSIPVYTEALLNDKPMSGTTPYQLATQVQEQADEALSLIRDMSNFKDPELEATVGDIRAIAYLGQYYAKKISGATNKYLYEKSTDAAKKASYRSAAISDLRAASGHWSNYAAQMDKLYVPENMARLHITIDFKAMQAEVDKEVTIIENNVQEPSTPTKPQHQMEFVFSGLSHYYFWHLQNMNLPLNWSDSKYAVIEMYATTSQKFNFLLNTNTDTLSRKGIQPVANKWVKVAIPLAYFKDQISAKRTAGKAAPNAAGIILSDVRGIGVEIEKPEGYPVIQTRAITLVNETPTDAMLVE